ncbi:flavodoxin family protein [Prevotella sp. P6B4]|uniref:flavodoxin family protein n=1 Tax=Prevotella sp. P6B4 TaxID=1410614 RepID=UPI000687AD5E|nr:flavodoxin family protein [Prevotella sp. P6B4]
MKKIMVIDGGPRKNMNTATMCEKFAEGARAAGADVKIVRLYDIDYKGCRSCMSCKLKNQPTASCQFPDGITDILAECASADGVALGSPIYFGEVSAQLRAFFERLTFPWLSYTKGYFDAPKKFPITIIYTMNGMPEDGRNVRKNMQVFEGVLESAGCDINHIFSYNTMWVTNYAPYDFMPETAEDKLLWRNEHWEQDMQTAYDAGLRMASHL